MCLLLCKDTRLIRLGLHPYDLFNLFSSAGKGSACNAGDSGSIPGLVRSTGEGVGHLYSWASLKAQLVKNPPAMWDT